MWVAYYRKDMITYGTNTNNIAEAINSSLKKWIKRQTKMSRCLEKLLKFLDDQIHSINYDKFRQK